MRRARVYDSHRKLFWKSNKDAVPASWPRPDRAPDRNTTRKMCIVNINSKVNWLVNHQNSESSHIKASKAAIQSLK